MDFLKDKEKIDGFVSKLNNCLQIKNKNCGFELDDIKHKSKVLDTSVNIDINRIEYDNVCMKFDDPRISYFLLKDIKELEDIYHYDSNMCRDFIITFKDDSQLIISFYDENSLEG